MAFGNPSSHDNLRGGGIFSPVARHLSKLGELVGNIRGGNGVNVWQRGNEIVIEADAALPVFTGSGWINGIATTGMNDTPAKLWLQIDMSTNPWIVTEIDGPPSSPWGDNVSYRIKSQIYGDLFFP